MSLLSKLQGEFADLLNDWRQKLEHVDFDGVAGIYRELKQLLPDLIVLVETTGGMGPAKKQAVLEAIGRWYDEVIAPKDLPGLPDWLVDPAIRLLVIRAADEAIDYVVAALNHFNLLKKEVA